MKNIMVKAGIKIYSHIQELLEKIHPMAAECVIPHTIFQKWYGYMSTLKTKASMSISFQGIEERGVCSNGQLHLL